MDLDKAIETVRNHRQAIRAAARGSEVVPAMLIDAGQMDEALGIVLGYVRKSREQPKPGAIETVAFPFFANPAHYLERTHCGGCFRLVARTVASIAKSLDYASRAADSYFGGNLLGGKALRDQCHAEHSRFLELVDKLTDRETGSRILYPVTAAEPFHRAEDAEPHSITDPSHN